MDSRTLLTAAAVGLLVAAAGCAPNPQLAPVGTPAPDPLTAGPTPGPTPLTGGARPVPIPAALPVLTTTPRQGATSLPWNLYAISADRQDLTVDFPTSCVDVKGAQVTERATSVEVTVWAVTGTGACGASLTVTFATIHLPQPLGDRLLLHAPVSRMWADNKAFTS